jgi:MarR family transcriptional regulator, 2-MHQ and catechol-resistance regulon repressor
MERLIGQREEARAFHRVLTELLRLYQFRDRDRVCCHDISVTQYYALESLILAGPSMMNELAAALFLDKSTASRVVDGLEKKGYVERRSHPSSRRAVLLQATVAGERLYAVIERELVAEMARLLAGFEPEVRHAMTGVLEALLGAATARMGEGGGGCCPGRVMVGGASGRK